MEQQPPQQQNQDRPYKIIYKSYGIRCTGCRVFISDCDECVYKETFAALRERHQHYMKTKFVELLNEFIWIELPNLSPEGRDRFEQELAARRAFLKGAIIYANNNHVNGLQIKRDLQDFEFNEPEARQRCNSTRMGLSQGCNKNTRRGRLTGQEA